MSVIGTFSKRLEADGPVADLCHQRMAICSLTPTVPPVTSPRPSREYLLITEAMTLRTEEQSK